MSRVLLINSIIREFAPPNNPPLGVLYLASVLEEAGHEATVCDLNALRWMTNDREYWLKKFMRKYDFIGLSGLIVTYRQQREVLNFILEHYAEFGCPVLMAGGGLPTSVPDFTLRNMPELDLIVIGEGEDTILDIVNGDKALIDIPGVAFRDIEHNGSGMIIKTDPRTLIPCLDVIPLPLWSKVPIKEVYLKNPIWGKNAGNSSNIDFQMERSTNMIVSRGCPHRCTFCQHYTFGKQYRLRSVSNVMSELYALKNAYDIDFVGYVDDNTTANKSWIMEFCAALIKADLNIHWGCSATIHSLDAEAYEAMQAAGCTWIGFGVETTDPELRRAMLKKGTAEQAADAVKAVRKAGMWANTSYIIGYPGETENTVRATAKWMRDNDCVNSVFFATPYPGTELFEEVKGKIVDAYGSVDAYIRDLADATDFKVNLTNIPSARLVELRRMMMAGEKI